MSQIQIGRYIAKNSIVHKIHPLIKLISIIILIATVAVIKQPYALIFSFVVLIATTAIAKIYIVDLYKTIKPFRFLLILTFVIQIFFTSDGAFTYHINRAMIFNAVIITYQFFFIISLSSLFTLTTSQLDIARALFIFIKPLKYFKVETKEVAISIIVAIRFIPLLFDLADRIITSQKLRGLWDTNRFGIFKNIKIFFKAETFIIPLFIKLISYAEKISITLNYKENIENTMKLNHVTLRDITALIISIGVAVAIIII